MIRNLAPRAGLLALLTMLVALAHPAQAQFKAPKFVTATAAAPKTVTPGQSFDLNVTLTIASPYHLQANPATTGYIATEVKLGTIKGLSADKTAYPPGMEVVLAGDKVSVYEGTVKVTLTVTPDKTLKPGKITVPVTVHYQGCNDQTCYPPTDIQTSVVLTVGKPAKKAPAL